MRKRIWLTFRIKYCDRFRQSALDLMVVCDDNVYSQTLCMKHRPECRRPDIDSDDERNSARRERSYRLIVKTVSFAVAVRKICLDIPISYFCEKIRKKCCSRNAVAIEIGIHCDAFTRLNRQKSPCHGPIHSI